MPSEPDEIQRDVLPIPDQPYEGLITYDAKDPDTSFPPIEPLRPPAGAPNVLVVLLDDVGFGRLQRLRRALRDPDRRAARRRRAEVQPLPHHRALLADPRRRCSPAATTTRSGWAGSPRSPPRPRLQLDPPEHRGAAGRDAEAERLLDRAVRQVPRGAGLGDEPDGPVRRTGPRAAAASSTSTASSAARRTSTPRRSTRGRRRSSPTARRRRATT